MESRRNGPQLSSRHDDDDDVRSEYQKILENIGDSNVTLDEV